MRTQTNSPRFSLEPCRTKAGYSAKLPQPRQLNLSLIKKEFLVTLETPILLVINTEEGEVIVHGYGELLFKQGKNVEKMRKIAEKVYETAW